MSLRPALRAILEVPLLHRRAPTLLLLAGLVVSCAFVWGIRQRLADGHRDSLKNGLMTAQYAADAAQELVRARMQSVSRIAYILDHITEISADKVPAVFQERKRLELPNAFLLWADASGTVVYASDAALVGSQLPAHWLKHLQAEDPVWLAARAPAGSPFPPGIPILKTSAIAGQAGVFVAVFPDERLTASVRKVLGELNGYVALRNNEGAIIAVSSGRGPVLGEQFDEVSRSVFQRKAELPDERGARYLAANNTDVDTGVTVIAGLDAQEAFADFEVRRAKTLWMSVAMGFVVLGLIWGSASALRRSARVEGKLRSLVALDHLTQLPNRRTFTELLESEVAKSAAGSQVTGLMFIDLDNFKYVNDSLGHDVGDQLLIQVGKRLLRSVRNSDVVCRIGGDEFTVVLPALASRRDAEAVAQRILSALAQPMQFGDVTLSVRASIGIALAPKDAQHTTQLVQCADMALYKAKAQGKGCYAHFEPRLLEAALARSQLTQDLRDAVARKEFSLVYQPKVCMKSGAVSGYEALLRWNHPRRGPVSPAEFIPVAEESDVILHIGDFVVHQAVEQVRAWYDQGKGWQNVAVNVSARQLRNGHITKTLRRCLVQNRVAAHHVQIELTETMLASDVDQAAKTLAELKSLGVAIAVDDFGTGYSSLSALQQLDVDCIKVDRSFVTNVETNHESAEICRAVVQLGHSMNLQVVAEGIETVAQYDYLMKLGCDEGQGYYFAKPLAPDEAIEYGPPITLFAPL